MGHSPFDAHTQGQDPEQPGDAQDACGQAVDLREAVGRTEFLPNSRTSVGMYGSAPRPSSAAIIKRVNLPMAWLSVSAHISFGAKVSGVYPGYRQLTGWALIALWLILGVFFGPRAPSSGM